MGVRSALDSHDAEGTCPMAARAPHAAAGRAERTGTMKVLTAGIGGLSDDFSGTVVGELVYVGVVCDRDNPEYGGDTNSPDACGCAKAFTGLAGGGVTTLAIDSA